MFVKEIVAIVMTATVALGGTAGFFCASARKIPDNVVVATGTTVPIATTTTQTPPIATTTTVAVATSTTETTMTETTTTTETTTETITTTTELTTVETTTEETTSDDFTEELNAEDVSREVYLLAYAMAREAADMEDAAYVGCVILNRVDDSDFPDSIEAVLTQPGQYPWGDPYYSESYIYDSAFYELAEELIEGYRPLPEGVVYQAQFPQGSGTYTKYGVHYYCYK